MRKKVEDIKKYVADFETLVLTEEQIKAGARTYVWAWALCDIDNIDNVIYGTDIQSFIDTLQKLNSGSQVYFHNLKFDGNFLLNYLIEKGYKEATSKTNKPSYSYSALVSDLGTWYNIKIKFKVKTIEILDSYKKLPFKVEKIAKELGYEHKGEIDYTEYREEGGVLSDEDKDYIRRDVQIVAKALKDVCFSKGLYAMTIGSDCMNNFKMSCPYYSDYFVELEEKVDAFCRKAYKGGYCYVNPKFAEKLHKKSGRTYDYNSMYPSVMHSKSGYKYPYGKPEYFTGEYTPDIAYPLYIQHLEAAFVLKENHVPTVQVKENLSFRENEYLEEVYEPVELYMTNVDLDLFFENYDIIEINYIDGYKFRQMAGIFDKYIDFWYDYKKSATIKKDAIGRLLAKLMLNNLYGKFGSNTNATKQTFFIDNGKLKHNYITDTKKGIYVPIAAFITSYARKELIEAIISNYDRYLYSDTDSIHLLGDENAEGIEIDNFKLGAWKLESTWTQAKFLRAKTYAEFIDNKWDIKCAGMPQEVKDSITDINKFYVGAEFTGKKLQKVVKGGVVLVDTDFKILDK